VTVTKRKLIEVALPLEAINRESAREKSIRHGHPSTLHLWWARRPLAAARAVLFAQLVDDPSARPEEFPTEEAQTAERKRLFELIEKLVVWENINNEELFAQAHAEILRSTGGNPPAIFDPFAGGGSIPLEAQRLGLEAHASDLNPVAVLINKALIEIPPTWAGHAPVSPGAADSRMGDWPRATGLAEDVRQYGQWMRKEAEKRIGHLYPQATLPDGSEANVIAWIWARTVRCPNPACGADVPLVTTWWLCKKPDRPSWIHPVVNGKDITFEIRTAKSGPAAPPKQGRGAQFTCLVCHDTTTDAYVKSEAMANRMGERLLATVAEGHRRRIYLGPDVVQEKSAEAPRPSDLPDELMPTNPRWFSPPAFGLTRFTDLFTARQLTALTTFSDLVVEARAAIEADARVSGMAARLASEYAKAVALYLAFVVDKMADYSSAICSWHNSKELIRNTFGRQAIPMVWDFAETNPFSLFTGGFPSMLSWTSKAIPSAPTIRRGRAWQADATTLKHGSLGSAVVATDPPYYDNIGYADLSDFFYLWLRRSLAQSFPELTGTMLTPKTAELIATPHRFSGSKKAAEQHFESGFISTFTRIRQDHPADFPVTLFYAFKQSETDESGVASTGWETMLNGLNAAGLTVTATWPMRTEMSNRMVGSGTNALASSIVLACRPRPLTAEVVTRRAFISALRDELPTALRELQQGSIPPVDLDQAAIGPGMAIFTRYAKVVETDGSDMRVRTALQQINQVLDEVLAEQEGDFDSDTRFCIKWFRQFAWNQSDYGFAETMATATNTSVGGLERGGIFKARGGKAQLVPPEDLSENWDPATDERVSDWEIAIRLAHTLNEAGIGPAAALMRPAGQHRDLDTVKELAYLLHRISAKNGWAQAAILFNGLGTSWNDLESASRSPGGATVDAQQAMDVEDDKDE